MFTQFNDAARLAVRLADEEAKRLGDDRIDTEHLLLGLLQLYDCVAVRVLAKGEIHLQVVRGMVESDAQFARILTTLHEEAPAGARDRAEQQCERRRLTAAAQRSIELAFAAADRLRHVQVGTGHLLLGLLEETEGKAFRVLCKLRVHRVGANLSRVAERVIAEMEKGRGRVGGRDDWT
jgi:ATP-dependent Clp protease ATP-binding subunit ClpC